MIMTNKRKDKSRVVLRTGELQRSNGTYQYSWTDANKKKVMSSMGIFPFQMIHMNTNYVFMWFICCDVCNMLAIKTLKRIFKIPFTITK